MFSEVTSTRHHRNKKQILGIRRYSSRIYLSFPYAFILQNINSSAISTSDKVAEWRLPASSAPNADLLYLTMISEIILLISKGFGTFCSNDY